MYAQWREPFVLNTQTEALAAFN